MVKKEYLLRQQLEQTSMDLGGLDAALAAERALRTVAIDGVRRGFSIVGGSGAIAGGTSRIIDCVSPSTRQRRMWWRL